jgi:hypothetical protein
MVAIVVKDLPRVSPFRLEVGQFAYYQARNQMKYALDREIPEGSGTMEI